MMETNTNKAADLGAGKGFSVAAAGSTLCGLNTEMTATEKSHLREKDGCMVGANNRQKLFHQRKFSSLFDILRAASQSTRCLGVLYFNF